MNLLWNSLYHAAAMLWEMFRALALGFSVCSVGNVPLASLLWSSGSTFGGDLSGWLAWRHFKGKPDDGHAVPTAHHGHPAAH